MPDQPSELTQLHKELTAISRDWKTPLDPNEAISLQSRIDALAGKCAHFLWDEATHPDHVIKLAQYIAQICKPKSWGADYTAANNYVDRFIREIFSHSEVRLTSRRYIMDHARRIVDVHHHFSVTHDLSRFTTPAAQAAHKVLKVVQRR